MCGESNTVSSKTASKTGATILESLAGTGKRYVEVQATTIGYPKDTLHVQVVARNADNRNRSYGLSANVKVPAEYLDHIKKAMEVSPNVKSQAGSGKRYLPMQVTTIGYEPNLHFQARDGKLNRDYGLAFTVEAGKLTEFIKALLFPKAEAPEVAAPAPKAEAAVEPEPVTTPSYAFEADEIDTLTLSTGDGDWIVKGDGSAEIELPWGELSIEDGKVTITNGDTTIEVSENKVKVTNEYDGLKFRFAL